MTDISPLKQGDMVMLFHHFPFAYDRALPLQIGPGVCMDNTPFGLLDSIENGLIDFILPGYSIEGFHRNATCFRCYLSEVDTTIAQDELLFYSLLALRLQTPRFFNCGGTFIVGDNEQPIIKPTRYAWSCFWSAKKPHHLTLKKITDSLIISKRLIEVKQSEFKRIHDGLLFFANSSMAGSTSLPLRYIGLFGALEAIFCPNKTKSKTLSKRASSFLCQFHRQFSKLKIGSKKMGEWIEDQYIRVRSQIVHGTYDSKLQIEKDITGYQNYGILHEITRLSLLGFISLENDLLSKLSESSGVALQRTIDNLNSASGNYLTNQRIWT